MIEEIKFSDRGQNLTEFELRLLAEARGESAWLGVGRRLVMEFGLERGALALAVILDELGGERLYVTPRRSFFEALWTTERDELIRSLITRPDWSGADIAAHLGVSRQYVSRITGKRQPPAMRRPGAAW